MSFQIAIFDPYGTAVDLSNLDFLQVSIFPYPLPPLAIPTNKTYAAYSYLPYPSTPAAPLISQTIPKGDIAPWISRQDWNEQLGQQVEVVFPAIDTASLNLGGQKAKRFLIVVQGITLAKDFGPDYNAADFLVGQLRKLTYSGGIVEVWESGAVSFYLPNSVAPLRVPRGTVFLIPENNQLPFATGIEVDGELLIDGALIDVGVPPVPIQQMPLTDNDGNQITDNEGNTIDSNPT